MTQRGGRRRAVLAALGLLIGSAAMGCAAPPRPAPAGAARPTLDVTLAVTLTDPIVFGSPVAPGVVEATLQAPDGAVRGRGSTVARAGVPWHITLRDDARVTVGPVADDTLLVASGGETLAFRVPPLALTFDRAGAAVNGRTEPGLAVRVAAGVSGAGPPRDARSDGQGRFAVAFPGAGSLDGRTPVTATVTTAEGHTLADVRRVPWVVISLHPGTVNGGLAPATAIQARLRGPGGDLVATAGAASDERGEFSLWFRNRGGNLVRPVARDTVELTDGADVLKVEVPAVTGAYDLAANTLSGEGVAGQTVDLLIWNPYLPQEYAEPSTRVGPDGRWTIDPGVDVSPASHFYVTQHMPLGDEVFYCEQIPAVHVEPGHALVEVETLWDVAAEIHLERGGHEVAAVSGVATHEGRVKLVPRDAEGAPVPVAAGDLLVAFLDGAPQPYGAGVPRSGTTADNTHATENPFATQRRDIDVPPMAAHITSDGAIEGATAPGAPVTLLARSGPQEAVADPTGAFRFAGLAELVADGAARPGETLEVYTPTPVGDHVRVVFTGPAVTARLGEPRLLVTGGPDSPFSLAAAGAAGDARATGILGPDGSAEVELARAISAGDAITLAVGSVTTTLAVPDLTARLDPRTSILTGTAPPGDLLAVDGTLAPGDLPLTYTLFAGDDGTWSVDLHATQDGRGVDPRAIADLVVRWAPTWNAAETRLPGPGAYGRALLPATTGNG